MSCGGSGVEADHCIEGWIRLPFPAVKIRFRLGILSSIVILLLIATSSIWMAGDWAARRTASSLTDLLMSRVGASVSERLARQLDPAIAATRSLTAMLEEGLISLDEPDRLLDMLEIHVSELGIDRMYVGAEDGRFFMVALQPDAPPRRRVVHPSENRQFWTWVNPDGSVGREDEPVSFDPRTRSWYERASEHGKSWTNVYRFESDNQPGITAAVPASAPNSGCEPCVVGADVTLAELSEFLERLEVSVNGLAFILDETGDLIAHPDQELVLGHGESLQPTLAPSPLVESAAAQLSEMEAEDENPFDHGRLNSEEKDLGRRVTIDGETGLAHWRVAILPLTVKAGLPPFTVAVAIPEADFLGTLRHTRFISVVIALFSIGLGVILAAVFSRGIARPILHLERSMRRVGSFDLDVDTKVDTVYLELLHMVEAFQKMVGGLRSFSRYVPKDVVRDLVATGRQAELGAEERELSICFSDIAGFTALCEKMEPADLVAQLGEYFETVVSAIKEQGGTIDKFIGDAIMALWNAPRFNPDHALAAALGALNASSAVDQLNERWRRSGLPQFETRFGISTATVVVGNVGSSQRLAYTALGDGVNLTSRLEGANKHYGTRVLASDSLVSRLPPRLLVVQPVDILVVAGKKKNVRIFEIIGKKEDVEPARVEAAAMYTEAFELYLAREFEKAARRFEETTHRLPGYRPAELLLERCRLFLTEPPLEDWDGSFVMNEK